MSKQNRTTSWNVRVTDDERKRVDAIAEALDVPAAQVVREVVREGLDKYIRTHPKLKNNPNLVEAV